MKITSISNQNFGLIIAPAPAYCPPAPAIIRNITPQKVQRCIKQVLPPMKFRFAELSKPVPQQGDYFRLHEAILPDTKIRVIGLGKELKDYGVTRNLKGAGSKNPPKILKHA